MKARVCEYCGKTFLSKGSKTKYCSKKCKTKRAELRRMENEQLCWSCGKACGGCSWSRSSTEVDGWIATPVVIQGTTGNIDSYAIKYCPEFIRG